MTEFFKPILPESPEQEVAARDYQQIYQEMMNKYRFGTTAALSNANLSDLIKVLQNPNIPEERKQALVAELNGMQGNLPTRSFMDEWSESIIGTSNYLKTMNEVSGNIGAAISNVLNANYEENYNSAPQQAARERGAGVNPDLSGVDPGQASDNNEMATPYASPSSMDGGSVANSFVGVGLQAVQLVTGFVSQVQGWISNDITNAAAEVGLDNALRDNIRQSFASVAQSSDELDLAAISYVQDYYSNFGESGLDKLKTRKDLDKWIEDYNKRNSQSPISIGDLYGSAILSAAKNNPNPYTSTRARRAYQRAINSISPNSPYVQSYIKSLQNQASGSELSDIKNKIQIQEFLGPLGDAYRASFKIIQDAENEINTYNRKYYHERNGLVPVDDGNGGVSYEDFIGLEAEAEANEFSASKMSSIATKYRDKLKAELRKSFDGYLSQIRESQGEDSIAYSVASILFPCLQMFMENQAGQSIGALISRSRPAPVNIEKTQNIGSITNNNGL